MRGRARHSRLVREAAAAAMVISIGVLTPACGKDEPPPAQGLPQPAPSVASVPQETRRNPATYQSVGRRDPFRPSRTAKADTPPTVHLTVTGIIRQAHAFYAVVESDISPGMGYIIRENDVVDSAKVVKITRDSVVFEVQTKGPEGKLLTRYVEKHLPQVVPR